MESNTYYQLKMTFLTEGGRRYTITVANADPALSSAQVSAAMDEIIRLDIFTGRDGCSLRRKHRARLLSKRVQSEPGFKRPFAHDHFVAAACHNPAMLARQRRVLTRKSGLKTRHRPEGCSLRVALGRGRNHSGAMATDDNTGMAQITAFQAGSDYTLLLSTREYELGTSVRPPINRTDPGTKKLSSGQQLSAPNRSRNDNADKFQDLDSAAINSQRFSWKNVGISQLEHPKMCNYWIGALHVIRCALILLIGTLYISLPGVHLIPRTA